MTIHEIIKQRLGGFLEYLEQIVGINPSRFRTDQLVQVLLFHEYLNYHRMLVKWQELQARKKAEEEANRDWAEGELVRVSHTGAEAKIKTRYDRKTGLIEARETKIPSIKEWYLITPDGERHEVFEKEDGRLYIHVATEAAAATPQDTNVDEGQAAGEQPAKDTPHDTAEQTASDAGQAA